MVGVQVLPLERAGLSFPTVQMVVGAGGGFAMQAPLHGCPCLQVMVGVQVLLGPQGLRLLCCPTTQGVGVTGVGVPMQALPQGTPGIHVMVGVQVLPVEQGASFPTVQIVLVGGGDVGAEIHCPPPPPQGTFGVEIMVGVQVLPVGQGALFPTVQEMMGGRLSVVKHTPWQGTLVVQGSVWVRNHEVGQGALFPMVQGMVYSGGGGGPDVEGAVDRASRAAHKLIMV
ncbi:hypothetical protein V8F06_013898 [Rhypophila decipiens]